MGSLSKALISSTLLSLPSFPSSPTPSISPPPSSLSFAFKNSFAYSLSSKKTTPFLLSFSLPNFICKAAEYKFPDPIPEFADVETDKFRSHLLKKLSKEEVIYGDSVEEVVGICGEIFSTFLHTEYGGPGTLLVIPFIDMADTIDERGLPGGPEAARAAVKWATDHVDKDWKEWTGTN
ncbi:Thiol-disulfide oxidoreductase DCC [Hibiscus syriacus]|uniref:Thiol-disulfide oxidoreductase DCC n=1 Tax=Hibiscus syriacus TaxID=106335 RepID=A0A6A2Z9M5_HIBSY|nr:protein PLASTID REDOX INSENSITIVE 2, chloroplastic-like [Hibiscus syriacus]KAE8688303.1 Thiol-disulfide oxidoreductase DCC [Hibiscus syriacus]